MVTFLKFLILICIFDMSSGGEMDEIETSAYRLLADVQMFKYNTDATIPIKIVRKHAIGDVVKFVRRLQDLVNRIENELEDNQIREQSNEEIRRELEAIKVSADELADDLESESFVIEWDTNIREAYERLKRDVDRLEKNVSETNEIVARLIQNNVENLIM